MAKEQANYPGSLDILTVDRIAGQAVPSSAFDIIEDAITEIEEELRRVTTKTAAATLTNNEGGMILVSCAITPYTLGLPSAVGNNGLTYRIIKTDDNTNLITVDADGTETINGSLTHTDLNYQWAYITIKSNNVNWVIINSSQTTTIRVTNLISPISNSINVKPDGDTDDFFSFKTLLDRPTIKREGGKFIYFESSNVYDVGISFRADDTYSGTLNYEKDNHMMTVLGKNSPFGFKANSDYVNYLKIQTVSTIPEITVVASGGLKINAGGTNALLLNHSGGNVGIGTASPSGLLDLNVATDADAHFLLSENDVTKWDIYNDHLDDALQIKAGATLVVELDISGNLDIKAGASYKIGGTALAVGDITNAQATLTFGIANTNAVKIDSASIANGEYAKFTATGLESKSFAEVKTDLSLNNVTNDAQIAKSLGTAQGDIIYFTGSATPARLAKGTAAQVLTMNAGATAPEWAAASGVPAGSIVAYGATTAPSGWLLCIGTAISRTTYSALFAIISTTYGVGDGSTTFNLPDLQQRFPLGKAAAGTGSTLGGTGGAIDHTHTGPSHVHTTASHTLTISEIPAHTHQIYTTCSANDDSGYIKTTGELGSVIYEVTESTGGGEGHSHGNTGAGGTGATSANNPPFQVVNYIIKT